MSYGCDPAPAATASVTITPALVRAHYELMARAYRVFWGEHLHHGLFRSGQESPQAAQLELIRHCLALVGDVNEAEVLDVGCGYGGTSIYLALHHRCRVTALTLSAKQADHARKRARLLGASSTARFLVVNAEEYAYSEGGYDLIWVMESSEHFLDRKLFFRRAASSLRVGGALLLTAWTANSASADLDSLALHAFCPNFQTVGSYLGQIQAAGLMVTQVEDLTLGVAPTWDWVWRRMRWLMPFALLTPRPMRDFAGAIPRLRSAFHRREMQYWVVVARKVSPPRSAEAAF